MLTYLLGLVVYPISVFASFAHKYTEGSFEKEFFGKRQTTTLKGVLIILVILHHFSLVSQGTEIIGYITRIGNTGLSLFYLLAGYTTTLGYLRAEKIDVKKSWINRAWRLYLPLTIFSITYNNFLAGLLFFFAFTDAAFILFKTNRNRLLFITFGNGLFVVLCLLLHMNEWWYDDVFTYFLGAALVMYKSQIIEFFKDTKKYVLILLLAFLPCIPLGYLGIHYMYYDKVMFVYTFLSSIVVVLVMMKLDVKSKLFCYLGQYTWEIFLTHQMFFTLFGKFLHKNSLVLVLSTVSSIAFGVCFQYLVNCIRNRSFTGIKLINFQR